MSNMSNIGQNMSNIGNFLKQIWLYIGLETRYVPCILHTNYFMSARINNLKEKN